MGTQMVRIPEDANSVLDELARETGKSKSALVAEAIREFQRRLLLKKTNDAYALLKRDTKAWRQELEERALWETAINDGLDTP